MWFYHPQFQDLITYIWKSCTPNIPNIEARFLHKLCHLRSHLRTWNSSTFGNINHQKRALLQSIKEFDDIRDLHPLSPMDVDSHSNLLYQPEILYKKEETMWKQCSRIRWLKEGDSNIKFFHRIANQRRRSNRITILDYKGSILRSHLAISSAFTSFYRGLIGTASLPHPLIDVNRSLLYPPSVWEADHLEVPFTEEEIKEAIFGLGADKSPGADGFNLGFYQNFWPLIREDLLSIFEAFFHGHIDLSRVNYAHIALIPKKGASWPEDFRLISLLNGI